jgi:uncharacterized protein with ParB-like and HNH nuclease domain
MNADDITLQALINAPNRYIIPVFQRYYSWEKENWEQLWDDIEELMEPENLTRTHFLGSLVFHPLQPSLSGPQSFQVIDGQQRLMTFSLLLCTIRYHAHELGFGELETEISERFLIHKFKKGAEHFRVYPRQRDREQYLAAITQPKVDIEGQIGKAVRFFSRQSQSLLKETDAHEEILRDLFNLLQTRIEFVCITLDEENPYQIFKSLNSTGVDLSEADLIRNFIFMHVDLADQDAFDDRLWRPLESHFEDEDGELQSSLISDFFRDFLMQEGQYVRIAGTFEDFEARYADTGFIPEELAKELNYNAKLYDIIRGVKLHRSPEVNQSLDSLRQLDSSTTYPLLLNLFHRNESGTLTDLDLSQAIDMIAGFIMRRFACGESSRAYGRWFVMACRPLDEEPLQNLEDFLVSKGYPSNARFETSFSRFNLYESRYARSILKALERSYGHKEPADLSAATIEHIMPQTLTQKWQEYLGQEAERIHDEWLHTVGNLTLSAYNSELRNRIFEVKYQEYKESNIVLNRKLTEFEQWKEPQIRIRGRQLAEIATQIWKGPNEQEK